MLKGIDPLLDGDVLAALDAMGHGDVLALVDRNFPADRYGRPVFRWRGVDVERALSAILTVFPLDGFQPAPVRRMAVDGDEQQITEVSAAVARLASEERGSELTLTPVERMEFYRAAREAMIFVQTGETVGYSCYLLAKGVV